MGAGLIADARALLSREWRVKNAGSLKARFALGAFWSVIAAGSSRAFILASSIVTARIIGKTSFGELGMIQSTAGTFGVFAGLNLGLTVTKYLAQLREKDQERVGRVLGLSSAVTVGSALLMSLVLVIASPYLAQHTLAAPRLARPLAIGAALIFFGALNGVQNGALAGFEAFRKRAEVTVWGGVLGFFAVVIGVYYGGLIGALWGNVASLALQWACNHVALRRECSSRSIKPTFRDCWREWPIFVEFSVPAFLSSLLLALMLFACNAMLARQPGGYAELGIYTAADRWRTALMFIPSSLFAMVFPLLFSLGGEQDRTRFRKVFRANLLLNLALVAIPAMVISAASLPIMAMYGAGYKQGWPTLVVLSISAIPFCLNSVFGQALVTYSMWLRFLFDVLLTVVLLGTAWLLIPHWKSLGLAVAYLFAFLLTTTAVAITVRRKVVA